MRHTTGLKEKCFSKTWLLQELLPIKLKKFDIKYLFLYHPQAKAVFYIILSTGYITEE